MNWARLIAALGAQIIPIFLHDPKQQQIVGVIAAEAQNVFNIIDQMNGQQPQAQAQVQAQQPLSSPSPLSAAPSNVPVGPKIVGLGG